MQILKNKLFFSILYFCLLLIDIVVKLNFETIPFRLITKPLVIISLVLFYIFNNTETSKKKHYFMMLALFFFLIGDMFLIFEEYALFFSLGLFSFVLGKLFYAFRFSNQRDFKLVRLIPVLSFCFIYMFILLNIVYDNLGKYFFPVLIYLFTTMIVVQFVYLRKGEVNYKSYLLVGIGVLFSVLADSVAVLKTFYISGLFFEKVTIMLFYGISQFLIVYGIIKEEVNTQIISPEINKYRFDNIEIEQTRVKTFGDRLNFKRNKINYKFEDSKIEL